MLDRLRGFFHDLSGHEPALLYFLEQFYYVVSVMFSPGESCYTGVLDKHNIPGYSAEFLLITNLRSTRTKKRCCMNKARNCTQLLSSLVRLFSILILPVLLFNLPHCTSSNIVVSGKVRQLRYEDKVNYLRLKEILGESRYSGELSSVFHILDEEVDLSGIPICAYTPAYPRQDIGEVPAYAMSYTGKNGSFRLKVPGRGVRGIVVYANGGEDKTEGCGSGRQIKFREDIKGSHTVFTSEYLSHVKKGSISIVLAVNYDGSLVALQREIDNLVNQLPSLTLGEIVQRSETLIGLQSSFVTQYPRSSRVIKDSIMSVAERIKQRQADEAFQSKQLEAAYTLYSDLVKFFPSSPSAEKNIERMSQGKLRVEQRQAYESLMTRVRRVTTTSRAIGMLESYFAQMSSYDPFRSRVQQEISKRRSRLRAERKRESEKEGTRQERLIAQDAAALKRFDVDLSITQLDLFTNPLGYRGKHIAVNCTVVRFETSKSAVMRGADIFYADFNVSPPKKTTRLNIIARIKGLTEIINADGTRSTVPYVEVVHLLNKMP